MNLQKKVVKKMCGFYVSDWHLTTMIFPYLTEKLKNKEVVTTILEKGIEENIKQLETNVNIETQIKEEISKIKWESTLEDEYIRIEEVIKEDVIKNKNVNILVNGSINRIEEINNIINKYIENNREILSQRECTINIINCYEVSEFNDITKILDKHDYVLNTSGEHEISEVFTKYIKPKQELQSVVNQ